MQVQILPRVIPILERSDMWKSKVKIKHLLADAEDLESIQLSMNDIAHILIKTPAFKNFNRDLLNKFRAIPKGDEVVSPLDYADRLLDKLYDYADDNRIWIE